MLERMLLPETHAIAILLKDHDSVKALFDRFDKASSAREKDQIIDQAVMELKIHASIEEEIFYPAVRQHIGKDIMNEADEEHHVARVLIAELDRNGRRDDHRDAKFTVLAESIRHHIKEEEGEMLPKVKSLELDFEALGHQMLERKKNLKANGIPVDAEHVMVMAAGGNTDSPAKVAKRRRSVGKSRSQKSRRPVAKKRTRPRSGR